MDWLPALLPIGVSVVVIAICWIWARIDNLQSNLAEWEEDDI